MLKTIAGRYILFGILGIESLILPYFLSKEDFGEAEFLKFTAFLFQFALFGAGTGYVIRYLKDSVENRAALTADLVRGAFVQALLIGGCILYFNSWIIALLSVLTMFAMALENITKVREEYLLAMSYKPILSLLLIALIPVYILMGIQLEIYVLGAFCIATFIYTIITLRRSGLSFKTIFPHIDKSWASIVNYGRNISAGFLINISTALTFLFFYIDRSVVREKFPTLLGDYSLSYAIMQMTIVAITAFSYVNVVEFGKEHADLPRLKTKVYKAFKYCFLFYIVFGVCSIAFAYGAEIFYGYDAVFETTSLMVGLFGVANVMGSLNAAHIYLGTIKIMASLMLVVFIISLALNAFIPYGEEYSYYLLLTKTYGLYFIFSVLSFSYVCYKLRAVKGSPII